jgi:hypothetical protein
MKRSGKNQTKLEKQIEAACADVAREVVLRARRTKTPIIVCEDGHVKKVPSSRFSHLVKGRSKD